MDTLYARDLAIISEMSTSMVKHREVGLFYSQTTTSGMSTSVVRAPQVEWFSL